MSKIMNQIYIGNSHHETKSVKCESAKISSSFRIFEGDSITFNRAQKCPLAVTFRHPRNYLTQNFPKVA